MRQEEVGNFEMPYAITDLTDAEADKLLALANPLAARADTDPEKLDALLQEIDTGSAELQELLADLAKEAGLYSEGEVGGEPPDGNYSEQYGVSPHQRQKRPQHTKEAGTGNDNENADSNKYSADDYPNHRR